MDEYGIAWRLKPWIAHKHGIARWFTWESTYYEPNGCEPDQEPKNVWKNPVTFDGGTLGQHRQRRRYASSIREKTRSFRKKIAAIPGRWPPFA